MARLPSKRLLLNRFEEAVRLGGWNLLYLNSGKHPARYQIYRGAERHTVKVYIWNITHGGLGRAESEYRIQVTGFESLAREEDQRSLLLGWWDTEQVFGAWDIRQHLGRLGSSPSMQISRETLLGARLSGFKSYLNAKGENALGIRPDFMGTYIHNLESLHDSGKIPDEADLLSKLTDNPADVSDVDIETTIKKERQYAIVSTKRALREIDFRRRVLNAYNASCAMCGVQLRLIDGAHVLPAAHPESTDTTSNGIALCAIHHRAYDAGLVTFDVDFNSHLNESMVDNLKSSGQSEGLDAFCEGLQPVLSIPAAKNDRPHRFFVEIANEVRGWRL